MKIRKGFVSNSSSSSFICDVTGHAEAGSDCCSAADYGFVEFECGHTVNDNLFDERAYLSWVSKQQEENEDFDEDDYWDGKPRAFCPICSGQKMSRDDYIAYALKNVLTEKDYLDIVKSFQSYKDFQASLK